ncbi:AAA family ATPase [Tenacibaculum finnmarkense]|uniref:AAA family ATPase n=1 Tax=Tenacibaculum finnmarkense TaxID=2781243 RepID=UPI001EFA3880|nr:AAA family ATPase [Tenacibaculum finnmarkense]MCG8206196.1 AAA family ATPase [Tenacibaculum finnmarkense genomovar finnmarkense]MCG8722300.1 AAA domain-containing protein [Tenacibaculum finnmarkense]MCG8740569.1 AAA domain-containing protein [Tenacibaculum finnmarkense]MCG8763969.1 AAA domain-containing protein [Tenacibaculum finnmarkense]MCG8776771.1 AAA domain-containing protein [Tenacibaculum finnmarkense]
MENKKQQYFPFSAIVGQDNFKLALILNLVDPLIGGVLAIGDKGTGKTTLIRSLTSLMGNQQKYPFVNLPIGVSEDRLLGSIDLEQLINAKKEVVNLGLMAQAHQGILYVDEVNLLHDYLTDILLDASASGNYYLEREGISRHFKSRFCLVGSMNPEEGNLRPQLKDRFGLSVNVTTPTDVKIRQKIIKKRFLFDDAPIPFIDAYKSKDATIAKQITKAKEVLLSIKITDEIIEYCSELAVLNQVEGLRADILLVKTARAFSAYKNTTEITKKDVDTIADFVLNHRSLNPNQNQQNQAPENQNEKPPENPSETNTSSKEEKIAFLIPKNKFQKQKNSTKNTQENGINSIKNSAGNSIITDTKKTVGQYLATDKFDLKTKRKSTLLKQHHIFLIDSSGSMLKNQIIAYAKGSVHKIAENSKNQNTQFSIISLFDGDAQLILNQTAVLADVEIALKNLKTGGKTNLSAGFKLIKRNCATIDFNHNLHIITDGKLNTENNLEDTVLSFQTYCKGIDKTQIIDAEKGIVKIGEAKELANNINANYEILITQNN